jgi:hypothetical protein
MLLSNLQTNYEKRTLKLVSFLPHRRVVSRLSTGLCCVSDELSGGVALMRHALIRFLTLLDVDAAW